MTRTAEQDGGLVHPPAQRADVLLAARQQIGERRAGRATGRRRAPSSARAQATTSADDDETPAAGGMLPSTRSVAPAGRPTRHRATPGQPPARSSPSHRPERAGSARSQAEAPGRETRVDVGDLDVPSAPRPGGHQHVARDGERQHRQAVVVGVLADHVHPARRPREHRGPRPGSPQPPSAAARGSAAGTRSAPSPEEALQEIARRLRAHPGRDRHAVVQTLITGQVIERSGGARLGSAHPYTSRATRAWSAAPMHMTHGSTVDIQHRAGQAVVAGAPPRCPQRAHLGMSAGSLVAMLALPARARRSPSADDDRSDGDLPTARGARRCRSASAIQRWSASVGAAPPRGGASPHPRPTVSRASAPRRLGRAGLRLAPCRRRPRPCTSRRPIR